MIGRNGVSPVLHIVKQKPPKGRALCGQPISNIFTEEQGKDPTCLSCIKIGRWTVKGMGK